MAPADLPAVMAIAGRVHPDYPEEEAVFAERFFFELVQREDYDGFGAPNAPVRLATQHARRT